MPEQAGGARAMGNANSLNDISGAIASPAKPRARLTYAVPVIIAGLIGVALAIGLTLNPREIPSVLIGSPVPEFELPPVQGRSLGLSTADLKGEVTVVNVWASWCTECREEHPLLMAVEERAGVSLFGLNYKDKPDDAENWLNALGDPYSRIGADMDGRVSIDWGVYGVPETFVIDGQGRIAYKLIGALTEDEFTGKILPLINELNVGKP
jgi:cytochrome c biogenesis protein CcmG/thiol:disulfide interchange protein DsbE